MHGTKPDGKIAIRIQQRWFHGSSMDRRILWYAWLCCKKAVGIFSLAVGRKDWRREVMQGKDEEKKKKRRKGEKGNN